MKLNRCMAVCLIASAFFFTSVYAADSKESQNDEGIIENLKNTWESVKDKAVDIGTTIGEKAADLGTAISGKATEIGESLGNIFNSPSSKLDSVTWEFINGKYSTQIVCTKDGNLTLTQSNATGNNVYAGTYTATSNKITFTVTKKTSKVLFITTNSKLNETWNINYSISKDSEMKLTSDEIPNDANGYDFSKATVFNIAK